MAIWFLLWLLIPFWLFGWAWLAKGYIKFCLECWGGFPLWVAGFVPGIIIAAVGFLLLLILPIAVQR